MTRKNTDAETTYRPDRRRMLKLLGAVGVTGLAGCGGDGDGGTASPTDTPDTTEASGTTSVGLGTPDSTETPRETPTTPTTSPTETPTDTPTTPTVPLQDQPGLEFGDPINGSGLADEENYYWGSSVVVDDEGTYQMFATRVPKDGYNFKADWLAASEIVRATADSPTGPWTVQGVALPPSDTGWDSAMTHNPQIKRAPDGTYCLFHIGTSIDGEGDDPDTVTGSDVQDELRYNQQTGLATADSPEGPWTRRKILGPRSDDKWDSTYIVNPTAFFTENGLVRVLYKAAYAGKPGLYLQFGMAQADSYEGEFERISDGPLDVYGGDQVEDGFIWYDSGYHFLLTKVFRDYNGYLAASPRGLEWSTTPTPTYDKSFTWDDGEEVTVNRRERPSLLFEDGTPTYLYTAIEVTDPDDPDYDTYSVAAPVESYNPEAIIAQLDGE